MWNNNSNLPPDQRTGNFPFPFSNDSRNTSPRGSQQQQQQQYQQQLQQQQQQQQVSQSALFQQQQITEPTVSRLPVDQGLLPLDASLIHIQQMNQQHFPQHQMMPPMPPISMQMQLSQMAMSAAMQSHQQQQQQQQDEHTMQQQQPLSLEAVAAAAASSPTQRPKNIKRVLANREAAKRSYKRRKKMIVDLHTSLYDMELRNKNLLLENGQLKAKITSLEKQIDNMSKLLREDSSAKREKPLKVTSTAASVGSEVKAQQQQEEEEPSATLLRDGIEASSDSESIRDNDDVER